MRSGWVFTHHFYKLCNEENFAKQFNNVLQLLSKVYLAEKNIFILLFVAQKR